MKKIVCGIFLGFAALSVAGIAHAQDASGAPKKKRYQQVRAEETGMHNLHSMRKVGRKTCFIDHYHSGSGSGATKQEAESSAIGSWQSFTAWEYGGSWGSWRLSEAKSVSCDRGGLGGAWNCSINSIPCRPF